MFCELYVQSPRGNATKEDANPSTSVNIVSKYPWMLINIRCIKDCWPCFDIIIIIIIIIISEKLAFSWNYFELVQ